MDRILGKVIALCAGVCLCAGAVEVGTAAPALAAKDIRYLPKSWSDFGERKAIVLSFVALQDPASVEMIKALAAYRATLTDGAVEVAMVSTGTEDSTMAAATAVLRVDSPMTVLKDRLGETARGLGVEATPAVVVLNGAHALVYRGSLAKAVEVAAALAAGESPTPSADPVAGRAIVVRSAPEGTVNYAEHIAPIMNQHCVECHREGRATPFTLTSYDDVAGHANMVKEVVLEERMPPWYASPEHKEFINARTLSTEEKDAIEQWVRGGKAQGDLAKAPALPELPKSEWEMGEPDLVLQIPEVSELPATGFVPYKYVTLPFQFSADTWIHGLQILPTNKAVVHHANIAYSVVTKDYQEEANFLTGYVPGGRPVMLGGPLAMLIPKNAVLTLQIHYVTTGKPETEQMKVGIRYAKENVNKRVYYQRLRPADADLKIPPNDPFWRISTDWTMERNATALALFTHMHVRGRDMEFLADYPDGKRESLLLVPNYSFDWQLPYLYMPGAKQIPKGTKLTTVSHYDNSSFNAYNPDPGATVPYGDQTIHEMNDAYIFYLDNDEVVDIKVDPNTGHVVGQDIASAK
jgi:mono/diheme cytochrome c family protein